MKGKERFLLWLLAGIIASQIVFLAWGANFCAANGGIEACPDFSRRWENTYGVAIATVLALLTGSALSPRPSSGARDDASASQPPIQLQQQFPAGSSEASAQAQEQDPPSSPSGPASGQASRKG